MICIDIYKRKIHIIRKFSESIRYTECKIVAAYADSRARVVESLKSTDPKTIAEAVDDFKTTLKTPEKKQEAADLLKLAKVQQEALEQREGTLSYSVLEQSAEKYIRIQISLTRNTSFRL